MTVDLVLATQNARYIHAAFGLRYLQANLGELGSRLLESTIKERPVDFVEKILSYSPRLVGLSCYIWNAAPALETVRLLKRLRPDVPVIVGGPEVSHELDQPLVEAADYVVTGEGEVALPRLCQALLAGQRPEKVQAGGLPPLEQMALPYSLYSQRDLRERVIYVEASRGCPFRCEFCLSSLDKAVRNFPLERLLAEFEQLLQRGAMRFKFVDRTFNLKVETSQAILDFFLQRYRPGLFCHFEMIPDRLPEALRETIRKFPEGALQFEVGIQTFDPEVGERISRRQHYQRLEENLRFLRKETGVHVHADLIVGLPGETLESFGRGFDRLVTLGPQEIQVGILKRLRGTPIGRHDQAFSMVYDPSPPYSLLSNSTLDFATMQRMGRFARYWDLVANQGRFPRTLVKLLGEHPFARFLSFSDWLFARTAATSGLAPTRLGQLLLEFDPDLAPELTADLAGAGQQLPPFLRRQARRLSRSSSG